jgi:hypothetical protein
VVYLSGHYKQHGEVNERDHTGATVFGGSLCWVMSLESTTWGSHRDTLGSLPRGMGRGARGAAMGYR